jgi:hypothetical protein
MHIAVADLGLDELWVVYPGQRSYELDEKIVARPLSNCVRLSPQ